MSLSPRFRSGRMHRLALFSAAALFSALPGFAARGALPSDAPSLILITLDTTRADHVGRMENGSPLTPNLDELARSGTRFTRAISPAPLTLPAHCTLMTGLNPPRHGVRDNGVSVLPAEIPTLATVLSARGYRSAAFVSSRVLDRRFGLARGFAVYDDLMVAEHIGEQGYPERNAAAVTNAALAWSRGLRPDRPYFLWVHYYDPHSPYQPPGNWTGQSAARRYAGEVAYMDHEIGRLLRDLPASPGGRVIATVGDHGEMLGEHGERDHGVFLYRGSLEVPLILSGPRVAAATVITETVGTRALPATLLSLLNLSGEAREFGSALPGVGVAPKPSAAPVYSETLFPADTYGWSPLRAASDSRWRLIVAPRPEMYDFLADPSESHNVLSDHPEVARGLRRAVDEAGSGARSSPPLAPNAELAASLQSLGYLSGASSPREGDLDPKDGIVLLAEFEQAKQWIQEGRAREAVTKLEDLVRQSPGNVPFLMRLGEAQLAVGRTSAGFQTLSHAVAINPALDFLHVRLAQSYAEAGQTAQAHTEYELALELNPRSAPAWSGLAEIARVVGAPGEEMRVLERSRAAGTRSATLLMRLAELEGAAGDPSAAQRHSAEARRLQSEP